MSGQSSGQDVSRDEVKAFLIRIGLLKESDAGVSDGKPGAGDSFASHPNFHERFAKHFASDLSRATDLRLQKLWKEVEGWCKSPTCAPRQIDPRAMLEDSIRIRGGLAAKRPEVDKAVAASFLTEFAHLVRDHLGQAGALLVDRAFDLVNRMLGQPQMAAPLPPAKRASPPADAARSPAKPEAQKGPAAAEPAPTQDQQPPAGKQAAKPEAPQPKPAVSAEATVVQEESRPGTRDQSTAPPAVDTGPPKAPTEAPPPSVPAPIWRYLPIPDEPDKHPEYDVRSGQSPEGMLILGARARGKKHKHEGTNCDDWFEFATAGKWSMFAVADGGGSYRFSRVGAKAACQGSVSFLAEELEGVTIEPRKELTQDIMNDDGVKAAKAAVHEAMRKGWQSIEKAFRERSNSLEHFKTLQLRDLTLRDMYSTLLLAVHTTIKTGDGNRSLVFSCAGGDGMIAVINKDGDCNLLMKPDSGEFSGEVEFLGPKMLTEEALAGRTFPFAGGAKALMLMTDGVADDYFPNSPRMAELYADLVLNEIIPIGTISEEKMASDLKGAKLSDMEAVRGIDFSVESERLLEKPEKITLASARKYAEAIGMKPEELVRRPGVLAAALATRERPGPSAAEVEQRLLVWLDSYHVRGSFDDRTLIVMAPRG